MLGLLRPRPARSCYAPWTPGAAPAGLPLAAHDPTSPTSAAQVLGRDHGVTKALARASISMAKADLWQARLTVKTLRLEQREAIAEAGEN